MTIEKNLPSYEELFGNLNFKEGDEARSVYSPAAYLTDLVQLLEDYFGSSTGGPGGDGNRFDLDARRSDIKDILLDGDRTFTQIPYLDIVNEILQRKIEGPNPAQNALDLLKTQVYPLNLPLNFDYERLKKFLGYLNVREGELQDLFSLATDLDRQARNILGLSAEEVSYFLKDRSADEAAIRGAFNLAKDQDLNVIPGVDIPGTGRKPPLALVPQFLLTTGLSGKELRELLFQNLSVTAVNSANLSEQVLAATFFINQGLGGFATLNADESMMVWQPAASPSGAGSQPAIPTSWFDRCDRFIRLARKTGYSFSDLDLVLRSCCGNQLNAESLQVIALIKKLQGDYELPVDVICAFFGNISTTGIGDLDEPGDLFNRTFNNRFAFLEGKYIPQSEFIPQSYNLKIGQTDANQLRINNDILQDENKEFRKRLQRTLQISDPDLTLIIEKFRARNTLDLTYTTSVSNNIQLPGLSLIFRMTKIAALLDLSFAELFDLFDLIELDKTIRTSSHFRILFPYPVQELNCYRIIDDPSSYARESLWLVQILIAIASWMRTTDFSTADLKFIQTGRLTSAENAALSDRLVQMLDQLVQAFLPLALNPGTFMSDQFDARSSRVIYETLLAYDSIVSVKDNRIVRFDEDDASRAADAALARLGAVTKDDFKGLNISGKMADKIYRNLVIYEFINADGEIVPDKLPADVGEFSIASDFSNQRSDLFNIVHDLLVAEQNNFLATSGGDQLPDNQELGLILYPSDLASLNLALHQVNDLMDNLIFNGYMDEEGNLSDPAFFAEIDNEVEFEVNTPLTSDHARMVFELIQKRMADFLNTPFKLESSIFNTLPLSDLEVQDLIENLKFNGYIDDAGMVIDKQIFFNLPLKKFKIEPAFYRRQGAILEAIRADLAADRLKYYHIDNDTLADIAEEIVAGMCFDVVQAEYLEDGKISESQRDFFTTPDNSAAFDLGLYFTPVFNQAVFARLAAIQQWFDRYHLRDKVLAAFGLEDAEIANLYSLLVRNGFLDAKDAVPAERYGYFSNTNNALKFSIRGYDDFNKDIFFALQDIAKDMQQRKDEIVKTLKGLATSQEGAALDTLAEGLEIDSESIRIICGYLFYNPRSLAEALLAPALASVGLDGRVTRLPGEYDFDRQLLRIGQFVQLARKLQFGPGEVEVALSDQNLVEKFPENLVLPAGVTGFDALLPNLDGKIYLFKGNQYWAYSDTSYAPVENAVALALLSPLFAGLNQVDAAWIDPMGNAWIISGKSYFIRKKGSDTWVPTERRWGLVDNNFDKAQPIQAAFTNQDGVSYLFSGDQYTRYSGDSFTNVDPGFPKKIQGNWSGETGADKIPDRFYASIDAAFESPDGQTILFKDDKFVRYDDSNPTAQEEDIAPFWGYVFNKFTDLTHLDAAFSDGQNVYLFLYDYVTRYEDQVENDQVMMSEGFPRRLANFIPGLPGDFEYGIDAIFKGADNKVYVFKNNQFLVLPAGMDKIESQGDLSSKWGLVRNNIQTTGQIDAAFTGLDGYTYLFSGDQYFRYTGKDFSRVDEGFPRTISTDWGGLQSVTSAFILDGKTYLFAKGIAEYVRYSTHDYTTPDVNFPKPFDKEEWWNLPASLVKSGFTEPDAVLIGVDNVRYLFKGNQFVAFDHLQRWWSEPQALVKKWHGLKFNKIDAAFIGLDGKTYLFSGKQFVRYSDPTYSKVDDRYPRPITSHWGLVANNIAQYRRIDSALVVNSHEMSVGPSGDPVETTIKHTYLFSGNQFFRYAGADYTFVEEGYPLTIRTALHEEPRFKNLKAPWQTGIDAAFADERNVYLVQGKNLEIISDSAYQAYDKSGPSQVGAAVIDEGSLYIQDQGTWLLRNNPEMETPLQLAELPPMLRNVPEFYQTGLSAILRGTDKNSYLFKGPNCYDLLLNNAFPAGEAWGTVRNQIVERNLVEAAFLGQDGKTYLFSGDQFVSYLPGTVVDMANHAPLIDGLPQPIARFWGGLANVRFAYVQNGVTYLAEKPDETGNFRIVRYSTADYSKPDKGYPRFVSFDWWGIPTSYQQEGFQQVDAVLTDEDNLFLIQGQEFIQFNYEKNLWTYARPINLVWRGLAFNDDNFRSVLAAFRGSDGLVYFFSQGVFAVVPHNIDNPAPAGTATPLLEIKLHWGHVDNHLADSGIVDAAFVWDDRETYLFSGPQYVKYSTNDYRHVDEGYPKLIWESLRQEEPFELLPEIFDTTLQSMASDGIGLSAAVANMGSVYLFIDAGMLAVSKDLHRSYGIESLGKMTNRILERNKIDAAYVNAQGQMMLLAGDQVFKYSDPDFDIVDEGYPRKIRDVASEMGFGSIDPIFTYDLDAVLRAGAAGTIYLFKGQQYLGSDQPSTQKQIAADWGKVRNNFVPVGTDTNMSLDAAFVSPNGMTYLFKGNQFIRYTNFSQALADEGYPLPIEDNWGNLPAQYEAGIDGGFVFEGKTYLLSNGQSPADSEYVRYSRPDYRKIDSIYPQKIADRAARWGDYLLDDIKLLSFFKQKVDETSSGKNSITDFLNGKTIEQADPYETLHAMFGWDISEVKWIQRNNAFLASIDPEETHLNLEIIERMTQIFATTRKLGADPSIVYAEVWQNWFDPSSPGNARAAADNLYRYLANNNSETDWATLQQQLHDELNLIQRDIFIPLSIALDPSLTRPKDLYDLLLIDVLMGSQARTSVVKEAISAIQLYFHRYLVNLEQPGLSPEQDLQTRELFKERWKWLKNYRVWEANRKVFLYPENYIRPELRLSKTQQFKDLESALLQGDLNLDTAEAAYTTYLENFGVIGNLKIAGANLYETGNDQDGWEKVLLLFGHTRMEPRQYYYRTASFSKEVGPNKDDLVVWSPWEKVDTTIGSDRVFPIMANGRVMIFWIEIEDIEEPEAKFTSKQAAETISEVNVTQKRLRYEARIKYSLRKFDTHWTPSQEIKKSIDLAYTIDAAYCEGDNDQVIVTFAGGYCQKTTQGILEGEVKRIGEYEEFADLPESFKNGIDTAAVFHGKRYLFRGGQVVILAPGQPLKSLPIRDLLVMPQSSDPFLMVFSGVLGINHIISDQLADQTGKANLILSKGVAVAFGLTDDILALVDTQGNYSFYQENADGTLHPIQTLQSMVAVMPFFPTMISTLSTRAGQFRPADAVFKQQDIFYVIRDGQYECFNHIGAELIPMDGFPKPIRGNLNFNMDKFFNKLHIENTGNVLNLSYTSPKDQLLLYGKLKQDFTFQEIPIQTDRAMTLLLSWNDVSQNFVQDYSLYLSNYILATLPELMTGTDVQVERVAVIQAVEAAVPKLSEALGSAQKIAPQETTNDGEDVPAVDQLQANINSNLGAITNSLSMIQNKDPLTGPIGSLLAFGPRLTGAVAKVIAARAKQKQGALDDLTAAINEGLALVNQTNDAVRVSIHSLVVDISLLVQRLTAYYAIPIQPDAAFHDSTYANFRFFLPVMEEYIRVWGERIPTSVVDELNMIQEGARQIEVFKSDNDLVRNSMAEALTLLSNLTAETVLTGPVSSARAKLGDVYRSVVSRTGALQDVNLSHHNILKSTTDLAKDIREELLGSFDLFPTEFGIGNTANFAFSEPARPDWYCFEAKEGAFLCRPLDDTPDSPYEITRLTTTVAPRLSGILFAQGINGLLSLATQEEDEAPSFDPGPDNIQFNRNPDSKFFKGKAADGTLLFSVPVSKNLDFHGATGIYYEELFFHAPFLIAQTLTTAQKFEEAKMWYEFIFDPTQVGSPWNYLPFREATPEGDFLIDPNQIKRYLDDPFDPHAIAALRPTAYRKTIVMNYIDNLLDWGDMLFRQYTAESIDEARMLYTLGSDLLGDRPEDLGTLVLSPPKRLVDLANTKEYDFIIQPTGREVPGGLIGAEPITIIEGTPHDSVGLRYFFVPENSVFFDYWTRVADRLFKIRNSLNIDGQAQPLLLFEPPINPMDLVQAVARGVSLGQLVSGLAVNVPHYRFEFLAARAQGLAQKLSQYGSELLATLEKKDAEALNQMQTQQEGNILKMTIDMYQAQIDEAEQAILNLEESQHSAQQRIQLYQTWIANGMLPEEINQINLLIAATAAQYAGSVLKIAAMIAHLIPNANIGPFIMGVTEGGSSVGDSLNSAADTVSTLGQGLSMTGEIMGVQAQIKHMRNDWDLQLMIAQSEDRQIGYQLSGARFARLSAEYNLAVLRKNIEQNQSIQTFLKEKFSNQDLYLWLISQTSGLYYQTYQMAFETARMAEKAFQFERGVEEQEASFITGGYWDSQRKGLLAGEKLTLDLDRMEQAFVETNEQRLEITREVSLLELDPLAFLRLKLKGSCEFSLDEAFFDYDFPGHYARQIKTIAVEFDVPEGKTVYATLTQLSHQTVLQPDPKAVKFLLAPKDEPPTTLRSNWRSSQQVALSHHDQYEKNNGMFELNLNSDRYLPFEGTGAVSHWKLELNGKKGSIDLRELVDITVHIQYTARPGGAVFADAVKGMLRPYQAMHFFDFTFDFPQDWKDYLDGDSQDLTLTFTRDLFPNMSSSKISGIFTHYDLQEPDQASAILNGNETWVLNNDAYLDTNGLNIAPKGSDLKIEYRGDKQNLRNIQLVFIYKASVR